MQVAFAVNELENEQILICQVFVVQVCHIKCLGKFSHFCLIWQNFYGFATFCSNLLKNVQFVVGFGIFLTVCHIKCVQREIHTVLLMYQGIRHQFVYQIVGILFPIAKTSFGTFHIFQLFQKGCTAGEGPATFAWQQLIPI